MLGTPERVLLSSSEQILDLSTDTLYVADTNHGADSPAIAKVNLREILAREKEKRPVLKDVMPVWFLKDREKYFPELFKGEQFERCKAYEDFMIDQGNFRERWLRQVLRLWIPPGSGSGSECRCTRGMFILSGSKGRT
ncbi:MAG: hypothetical protein IPJ37_09490 [Bacteroidales bacterium]|nr:hypothetical protein [Bacteroidales bacterium]